MTRFWLDNFAIDEFINSALREDMYYGDITTDSICASLDQPLFEVNLVARQEGILAGRPVFERVFQLLSGKKVKVEFNMSDGDLFFPNDIIATIKGDARYILTGERLALNFVQKMSGIATTTRRFQDKISKYGVRIADTRKTTPNFRLFEKYAVRVGCHHLHRFSLSDSVMLKDNHIALYGGSITLAVKEIRRNLSHVHKIEVECDKIEQVQEALSCNVDIILLDNMTPDELRECCRLIDKKAIVEASGCITFDNIEEVAQTGVDVISTSSIIMRAATIDLAFDYGG